MIIVESGFPNRKYERFSCSMRIWGSKDYKALPDTSAKFSDTEILPGTFCRSINFRNE
jgi:hypothetical protein